MNHQQASALAPDYVDGLLDEAQRADFEAHLRECPDCQESVASFRALRQTLSKTKDMALSDEARLRLYQRFNEERARRGESLLRVPADLLARVKPKAAATPEAAKKLAGGGKEATLLAADSGAHMARSTGRGAKRFGGKMKRSASNAGRHLVEVAREAGRTAANVGRIVTVESYEVLREAPRSKGKALLAPPKLMGKGVKAGARMMTGTAKVAAKSAKGGAVLIKDGASTAATGMIESARLGKAFAESTDKLAQAGEQMARGVKEAARTVIEASESED